MSRTGLVPLLISHEDHLVTLYVDANGSVRGVESVLLVEAGMAATAVSEELGTDQIEALVEGMWKLSSPFKDYGRFLSSVVMRLKTPESLFLAGEFTGRKMWTEWRREILRMGARYQPDLGIIVKSELRPILERAGMTRPKGDTRLEIYNIISPQFVVGMAQGVLDAISEAAEGQMRVKIEYTVSGNVVSLSLVQ